MGQRQAVHTVPLVQVMPSYKADASNIKNAIATINRLTELQEPTYAASTANTPT